MDTFVLYLCTMGISCLSTWLVLPGFKRWVGPYVIDEPGGLKTHIRSVPAVGGCGILFGLAFSLLVVRLVTRFPSGTLHSLRGVILGGTLIFAMGLWDDIKKPQGLPIWAKLLFQAAATACLIHYGIFIRVFSNLPLAYGLSFLWVVGLTNAFNLLDIMDGLCALQAVVCTLGLAVVALPSEFIYVNFAAVALLGTCMAFLPFNFSTRRKIFLGDSGSNLLGFLIASLCLATGYSQVSNWGFLAPLLIALVPIADISFVSFARLKDGKNPLKGSPDHAALRLQRYGWNNRKILGVFTTLGVGCNVLAWIITFCPPVWVGIILAGVALGVYFLFRMLLNIGVVHAR